ncbi:hypothetical protein CEV32_2041 [Brucella rhizosphaerae]|uniref:Uncharacterized protein n=1 Tax=Brucella rhizosphaerae TaxID=571254 RepID=A0A256F5A5_9HYPH|nr:hypothetical protein CEV32_2041 [Brucella rhizosphaerae]
MTFESRPTQMPFQTSNSIHQIHKLAGGPFDSDLCAPD